MEGNLGRVDQGPINYRWKHGAGGGAAAWRWKRQLHRCGTARASGSAGCATAPSSPASSPPRGSRTRSRIRCSSCGRLRASRRSRARDVDRRQEEPQNGCGATGAALARPAEAPRAAAADGAPRLGPARRPRDVTYDASVAPSLLEVPQARRGVRPPHQADRHATGEAAQRARRARARPRARAAADAVLVRAGVLAVAERCTANDHKMRVHVRPRPLRPARATPQTPTAKPRSSIDADAALSPSARAGDRRRRRSGGRRTEAVWRGRRAPNAASVTLHRCLRAFDTAGDAARWHADGLLSDWCCTSDERFKRRAGIVPLGSRDARASEWRGRPELSVGGGGARRGLRRGGRRGGAAHARASAVVAGGRRIASGAARAARLGFTATRRGGGGRRRRRAASSSSHRSRGRSPRRTSARRLEDWRGRGRGGEAAQPVWRHAAARRPRPRRRRRRRGARARRRRSPPSSSAAATRRRRASQPSNVACATRSSSPLSHATCSPMGSANGAGRVLRANLRTRARRATAVGGGRRRPARALAFDGAHAALTIDRPSCAR